VRVTQKNDTEKICKQHFVVLAGFNSTSPQKNDHKATGSCAPLALAEAIGSGLAVAWCVQPRSFGSKIKPSYRTGGHLAPVPGPVRPPGAALRVLALPGPAVAAARRPGAVLLLQPA
jgi:hypothetical protein